MTPQDFEAKKQAKSAAAAERGDGTPTDGETGDSWQRRALETREHSLPAAAQRMLMKGLSFNSADNIIGMLGGAFNAATGKGDFASERDRISGEERALDKQAQEEHPIAAPVSEVVGMALPTLLSGGSTAAPSLMRMAGVGGASASAAAAGAEDEGGVGKRLSAAVDAFLPGAVAAGVTGKLVEGGGKIVKAIVGRGRQPSGKQLEDATTAAYDAVRASGDTIPATDLAASYNTIKAKIHNDYFYNPAADANKPVEKALQMIQDQANTGRGITFGEAEAIVKQGWKAYNNKNTSSPFILDIINGMNDVMDQTAVNSGNVLLMKAREASRVQQNVKMFDKVFEKAKNKLPKGGSKDVSYRDAARLIIDDPRLTKFLRPHELDVIKQINDGSLPSNAATFFGKSAPNANGLMSGLWILGGGSAAYNNPAHLSYLLGTAVATTGAKMAGDIATSGRAAAARGVLSGAPVTPVDPRIVNTAAQVGAREPEKLGIEAPISQMLGGEQGQEDPTAGANRSIMDDIIQQRLTQ